MDKNFINKNSIDCIVFDFDGVMTDNHVYVDENGHEIVRVSRADGIGINIIKDLGIVPVIISNEKNNVVSARAEKLGIKVYQGVDDKVNALMSFSNNAGIELSRILYVGNDINDMDVMRLVGYTAVPADAYGETKNIATFVLETKGGDGVAREIALILSGKEDF